MNARTLSHCRNDWQNKWLALDCHDPKIQRLADEAQLFAMRWYACNRTKSLLILVGESNCAKTHTAKAIYRFANQAALHALDHRKWPKLPATSWFSWPEACLSFAESPYTLQEMLEADLLFLDDIGADVDPWKNNADKLCQVLSRRESMFTVITTNISQEEWANRFTVRIADRLYRNSVIVDLTGLPSYATL